MIKVLEHLIGHYLKEHTHVRGTYVIEQRSSITSFSRRFCTFFCAVFIDLLRCVSSINPNYIHPDVITKDNDGHDDICRPFSQEMGKIHDFHLISCYKIFNICICTRFFLLKYLEGCIDATDLRPLESVE